MFFIEHINAIAIGVLGLWLGYLFAWGLANLEVSATGFVAMATFIFTGPVIELVGLLKCQNGTAIYILSGVLGGLIYLVLLTIFKFSPIKKKDQSPVSSKLTPIFPWLQ